MDEIALSKVRALWGGQNADPAKAKANRRHAEKAASKSSDFWTGRSAQLNIRMTPELKSDVQAAAAEFGMTMADFFETAVLEFITKRRAKK
jgi:hypothetical protein